MSRKNVIFEFHTPELMAVFPQLIDRSILHIHGSEVRGFNNAKSKNNITFDTCSPETQELLSRVPLVLYSTPDLASIIAKYTSQMCWFPHPIEQVNNNKGEISENNIFFPNSWSLSKGANLILPEIESAQSLLRKKNIKLQGLKLGEFSSEAEYLGIELLEPVSNNKHRSRLTNAKGTIGQVHSIGVTDLEAVLLSDNHFQFPLLPEVRNAYQIKGTRVQSNLIEFILNPKPLESELKQLILDKHSQENVREILQLNLQEVLGIGIQ